MLKVDAMMSYGNPVSTVQTLLFYGWNPKEEGRSVREYINCWILTLTHLLCFDGAHVD
jgi:hypothetical protein